MSDQADLERRLKELEDSGGGQTKEKKRPSGVAAAAGILGIVAIGGVFYILSQDDETPPSVPISVRQPSG